MFTGTVYDVGGIKFGNTARGSMVCDSEGHYHGPFANGQEAREAACSLWLGSHPELDQPLLSTFLPQRLGYGNPSAPYWFLGAEEGFTGPGRSGLASPREYDRLCRWIEGPAVEDILAGHERIQITQWFGASPTLQSTWAPLIELLLAVLRNESVGQHDVRAYQAQQWGRAGGETLVAELLPLPNPDKDNWLYRDIGGRAELRSRSSYRAAWLDRRVSLLRAAVNANKPRFVVCYTKHLWQNGFARVFAGARWTHQSDEVWLGSYGDTSVAFIHHPASRTFSMPSVVAPHLRQRL